jgi:hypothetical protein
VLPLQTGPLEFRCEIGSLGGVLLEQLRSCALETASPASRNPGGDVQFCV